MYLYKYMLLLYLKVLFPLCVVKLGWFPHYSGSMQVYPLKVVLICCGCILVNKLLYKTILIMQANYGMSQKVNVLNLQFHLYSNTICWLLFKVKKFHVFCRLLSNFKTFKQIFATMCLYMALHNISNLIYAHQRMCPTVSVLTLV